MRKKNYLFGALAVGLGILVGTLSVSLLMNSGSPTSFISKLRGQDKIQTVSGVADNSVPSIADRDRSNREEEDGTENLTAQSQPKTENDPELLRNNAIITQKVVSDYKQNIGTFFGAWKSKTIAEFRAELAKAYTGDLYEKHVRRGEKYLAQGIGLDVSEIVFDQVDVENVSENAATLRVDYHYRARDYNLTDGTPMGEEHEQIVQVRVNLIKQGVRWVIAGESTVQ